MNDSQWDALTNRQWLEHRIARCAEEGWTANKERYQQLLSALQACSAPWDSGEGSAQEVVLRVVAEFHRRMEIAAAALGAETTKPALGSEEEKDERAIAMVEAAMNHSDLNRRSRTEVYTSTLRRFLYLVKRAKYDQ